MSRDRALEALDERAERIPGGEGRVLPRRHERQADLRSRPRYLEVEPPDAEGSVVVDFNDAYNPYCAYNPEWSCPIPPGENWLPVPIRAGERNFEG